MSTARLVLRSLRQGLGRVMKVVLVLGLLYVGVRLFGDDNVLRGLDVMESRVVTAWQRLREYRGMW